MNILNRHCVTGELERNEKRLIRVHAFMSTICEFASVLSPPNKQIVLRYIPTRMTSSPAPRGGKKLKTVVFMYNS